MSEPRWKIERGAHGEIVGVDYAADLVWTEATLRELARLAAQEERARIAQEQRCDALRIRNDLTGKMLTIPLDAKVPAREALELLNNGIAGAIEDWASWVERGEHWRIVEDDEEGEEL